jgi:predicted dehydrogenase
VPICEKLVAAGIPFLTEKPLSAEADGPVRLAAAIEAAKLVVAVGYHLRALDIMTEVRERLAAAPPQMVVARWLDSTPKPAWWGKVDEGGGQVIEQATHLYDLARHLIGEATVVGAASTRLGPQAPGVDVADSTSAVLRFENGAIGSFANTRRIQSAVIEVEFVSDGLITTLEKRSERGQRDWYARFDDGSSVRSIRVMADPYETQAAAFFDAVEKKDPSRVLSTYADALKTDRLTRAVVAATGAPG